MLPTAKEGKGETKGTKDTFWAEWFDKRLSRTISIQRWDGTFLVGRATLKEGINTTFMGRGEG